MRARLRFEAEDLHAVRLMTIHAAKGLEFPVVCVADLGRSGRGRRDALRVTDDGRVGLKIASFAGGSAKGLELEAIEQEQEREQDEEERRIFYVAMTRAQELLVLSGATDTEKWPAPQVLGVPMNWIWRGFAPGLDAGEPRGARSRLHPGERRRPPRRRRALRRCAGRRGRHRPGRAAQGVRTIRGRAGVAGRPALVLGPRALPRMRLPLLPRAGRGLRELEPLPGTSRSPSRRVRTSCRRCCVARSFTSSSSDSISPTR